MVRAFVCVSLIAVKAFLLKSWLSTYCKLSAYMASIWMKSGKKFTNKSMSRALSVVMFLTNAWKNCFSFLYSTDWFVRSSFECMFFPFLKSHSRHIFNNQLLYLNKLFLTALEFSHNPLVFLFNDCHNKRHKDIFRCLVTISLSTNAPKKV